MATVLSFGHVPSPSFLYTLVPLIVSFTQMLRVRYMSGGQFSRGPANWPWRLKWRVNLWKGKVEKVPELYKKSKFDEFTSLRFPEKCHKTVFSRISKYHRRTQSVGCWDPTLTVSPLVLAPPIRTMMIQSALVALHRPSPKVHSRAHVPLDGRRKFQSFFELAAERWGGTTPESANAFFEWISKAKERAAQTPNRAQTDPPIMNGRFHFGTVHPPSPPHPIFLINFRRHPFLPSFSLFLPLSFHLLSQEPAKIKDSGKKIVWLRRRRRNLKGGVAFGKNKYSIC